MFLRFLIGFICLFALGFASRAFLEYLDDSQERARSKRVAMDSLIEGQAEETGAGEIATLDDPSVPVVEFGVSADGSSAGQATNEVVVERFVARVFDGESGAPLPGVSIECEGNPLTSTDAEGRFVLERPPRTASALALLAQGYGLA